MEDTCEMCEEEIKEHPKAHTEKNICSSCWDSVSYSRNEDLAEGEEERQRERNEKNRELALKRAENLVRELRDDGYCCPRCGEQQGIQVSTIKLKQDNDNYHVSAKFICTNTQVYEFRGEFRHCYAYNEPLYLNYNF